MTDDRSSWLTPDDYLAAFAADGDRLAALARASGLHTPVPTCPGWSMLDLVRHCGDVYAHKISVLRLGRRPEPGEWQLGEQLSAGEAVDRHDAVRRELVEVLAELGADAPCWTWREGEDSAGFWFRRMAHEALVHRVDAEAAAGARVLAAAPGLAADGVHEVLSWFAGDVLGEPGSDDGAAGSVLVVATSPAGEHCWRVDLPDGDHVVTRCTSGDPADARLAGAALALDLDLWGRSALPPGPELLPVQAEGSPEVITRLRARIAIAAQ